ncbi:MAG TPA: hypothetical protein VK586_20840 [Streptosporangiaceae bacterium]|nr:hypothetical protein [Streptosporangiaceae bacterium]
MLNPPMPGVGPAFRISKNDGHGEPVSAAKNASPGHEPVLTV